MEAETSVDENLSIEDYVLTSVTNWTPLGRTTHVVPRRRNVTLSIDRKAME